MQDTLLCISSDFEGGPKRKSRISAHFSGATSTCYCTWFGFGSAVQTTTYMRILENWHGTWGRAVKPAGGSHTVFLFHTCSAMVRLFIHSGVMSANSTKGEWQCSFKLRNAIICPLGYVKASDKEINMVLLYICVIPCLVSVGANASIRSCTCNVVYNHSLLFEGFVSQILCWKHVYKLV
jgi:hypothetical protein